MRSLAIVGKSAKTERKASEKRPGDVKVTPRYVGTKKFTNSVSENCVRGHGHGAGWLEQEEQQTKGTEQRTTHT